MLTVSSINYSVPIYKNNTTKQQQKPINFQGKQSISKTAKYTGASALGIIMGLMTFTTCNNNDNLHDVELRWPSAHFHPNQNSYNDTIKIEDGCGFENTSKKYVMDNGKLMAYDKKKHVWEEAEYIQTKQTQLTVLERIANLNDESKGKLALSNKDIKDAKDDTKNIERSDMYGSYEGVTKNENNELTMHIEPGMVGWAGDLTFRHNATDEIDYKYGVKFTSASPVEIANDVADQISGWSKNDNTVKILDAIPSDKLVDVARAYRKNNDCGIIEDLGREYEIKTEDVISFARRFRDYIEDKEAFDDAIAEIRNNTSILDKDDIGFNYSALKKFDNLICNM